MNERTKAVVRAAVAYEENNGVFDKALLSRLRFTLCEAVRALTPQDLAECEVEESE